MKRYLIGLILLISSVIGYSQTYLGETSILPGTATALTRIAFPFVAPATGTLDEVCFYYSGEGLGPRKVLVAVYDNSYIFTPSTRLGVTDTIVTTSENKWLCAPLLTPTTTINANDTIWLAIVSNAGLNLAYNTVNSSTGLNRKVPTTNTTFTSGMPNPFGTTAGTTPASASIYAHYTVSGASYTPVTGRDVWAKYRGANQVTSAEGNLLYFKKKSPPPSTPVYEDAHIIFADNLDDLSVGAITSNTIVNRWQAIAPNFREDNQSIVDKGAPFNKSFRSKYDLTDCTTNQGIELGIMLDTVYQELYMDVNVCYSNGYDTEHTVNGTYGGKGPNGGFWGGNHWNVDNDPWVIDTIGDLHGWSAHNGMGSGANAARQFAYIYEIRTWNKQYNFGYTGSNQCHIYTRRVKVNDPGEKNAIVATYVDGILTQQIDTLWFQSVTQLNNNLGFIEGAVIKHSLNSCTDELIYVDIDNIVVYKKNPTHSEYISGPAPVGHTITPLSGTVTTNVFVDPIMFNETRTTSSGTIKSHYTGASYHPDKEDGTTYTKVVNNNDGAKYIKFTSWHDGVLNVDAATGMWVKVYSGVGTGGTLLYTFDEATYNGVPTLNTNYTVPTSFTIEFHPSTDVDLGFSLDYLLQ